MISLRGPLCRNSTDGAWEWSGVWAFGTLPAENSTKKSSSATQQPPSTESSATSPAASSSSTTTPRNSKSIRSSSAASIAKPCPFKYRFFEIKDANEVEVPWETSTSNTTTNTNNNDNKNNNNDNASTSLTASPTAPTKNSTTTQDEKREQEKEQQNKDNNDNNKQQTATFGNITSYTDAGKLQPSHYPPGGSWKGWFENATIPTTRRGKDRTICLTRVTETFYLFFNATPPPDAPLTFSEINDKNDDNNTLPTGPGHVHVRGKGSNQFGTFALLGSWSPPNTLHLQRMYVVVPPLSLGRGSILSSSSGSTTLTTTDGFDGAGAGGLNSSSKNSTTPKMNTRIRSRTMERKSYFTRKKLMSWQKRDSSSDDEMASRDKETTTATKSKVSITTTGATATTSGTPSVGSNSIGTGQVKMSGKKRPRSDTEDSQRGYQKTVETSCTTAPALIPLNSPSSTAITCATTVPSLSSPSSNLLSSSAAPTTSTKNTTKSHQSRQSHLKLPPSLPGADARWRQAYFLHYQKTDDTTTPTTSTTTTTSDTPTSANTTNASSSSSPIAIVYEGEHNHGHHLRDGHGVCLYPSGLIYEGQYRRNRESGRGILRDGRRGGRIVYDGDWERGKLHGRGRYYYYNDDVNEEDEGEEEEEETIKTVSMTPQGYYEGDLKETVRHGIGRYVLPDGSIYDGEWRDGAMNGRGTFEWTDGSVYMGQFKDGARHGTGILRCSDNFTYEGQWVNNAMEGRGMCVYPNGQKYEGMFVGGRKEGRGTLIFTNGAVYEGRFKDDAMEGQGTMKMKANVIIRPPRAKTDGSDKQGLSVHVEGDEEEEEDGGDEGYDWMIPIEFQSDMGHIHQRAGFTKGGS